MRRAMEKEGVLMNPMAKAILRGGPERISDLEL